MIEATLDFIASPWKWDSYHLLAVISGICFASAFIWLIYDSFFKKK